MSVSNLTAYPLTTMQAHTYMFYTQTDSFSAVTTYMHKCTHQTLSTTYGISFNPLFLLSQYRSYNQPMMDTSVNKGYIISNS